ncbi:MAG: di-trans,poly-cis-decaprenylcistransferase [Candidatus Wildermuthbacteria bacterium]|nr:di-trans,poly-cis-decaprenylcistransferase [Candidatus Wildermuthbacteria bacterium]
MFEKFLGDQESIARFQKEGVRVRVIGQKDKLRPSLQNIIEHIEQVTKDNKEFFLNLGVSYGGRWDILQAAQKVASQGIDPKQMTEQMLQSNLSTAGLPDPDLVIRAGGEQRFSNFLLWQSAYAELYFCDKFWPAFTEQDLEDALAEYARRQRRFGH